MAGDVRERGSGMKLTVVGETLGKLYGDDQEGGEGEGVRDVTKGVELGVSDILRAFDESIGEGFMGGRAIDLFLLQSWGNVSHGDLISVGGIGGHFCADGEMGAPGEAGADQKRRRLYTGDSEGSDGTACLNWKIRHAEHVMMDHAINLLGTRRSGSARPLLHGGA